MEEKTKISRSLNYSNGILTLSGAKEVVEFSEKEVEIALFDKGLVIKGNGLKVLSFDAESGNLKLEGDVDGINYTTSHEKLSLVKRLFK